MVRRIDVAGWTAARVAEAFASGERTGRKWLVRYRAEGLAGPENRSGQVENLAVI